MFLRKAAYAHKQLNRKWLFIPSKPWNSPTSAFRHRERERINTPDFQTSLHKHLAVFVIRNLIFKCALWHHYWRAWHYCAASYQRVCSQAQPRWRPLLFPCWGEVIISKIRHAYFGKKLSYSVSMNADELLLWRTSVRGCSLFKNATLLFWCCPNKRFNRIKVLICFAEDQINNRGWLLL